MRRVIAVATILAVAGAVMGEFRLSMTTYRGGGEKVEELAAVEVVLDGHLVVAGSAPGYVAKVVEETG